MPPNTARYQTSPHTRPIRSSSASSGSLSASPMCTYASCSVIAPSASASGAVSVGATVPAATSPSSQRRVRCVNRARMRSQSARKPLSSARAAASRETRNSARWLAYSRKNSICRACRSASVGTAPVPGGRALDWRSRAFSRDSTAARTSPLSRKCR